jgi:hypothetical protein
MYKSEACQDICCTRGLTIGLAEDVLNGLVHYQLSQHGWMVVRVLRQHTAVDGIGLLVRDLNAELL